MSEDDDDKTVVFSVAPTKKDGFPPSAQLDVPSAKLVCTDASQIEGAPDNLEIKLENEKEVTLGRGDVCEVHIKSRKLSRKHARIFAGAGKWGVEDLNSTNGVFVNGKRSSTAWLRHGDEVKFGPVTFEFLLDKPTISAISTESTDNYDDDDDDVEKTMMFGSVKSSEAFLQAAKEVKEEEKKEKKITAKPKKKTAATFAISAVERKIPTAIADKLPTAIVDKLNAKIIGGITTVIIIAMIASWYPNHLKRKEIASSIRKCTQITKIVVSSARDRTNAQVYTADYENDLIKLSEISAKMQRLLKNNMGNVPLSNQTAKIAFLEFERDFAKQLDNRNLHEASIITNRMIKKSEEIAAGITENVRDDEIEAVNTVAALSKFAKTIIAFRSFAQKHPIVSETTATNPDDMGFSELQNKKADFFRYRRTYNSALSVNYLVFKKIVDDVDKRDISLFDEWIGFFINRAEPKLF